MTLDEIAIKNGTDKSSPYHNYCNVYERYMEPYRQSEVKLLEVGVQFGFSVRTWLEYFENGRIYGVDILKECKYEHPRLVLEQGDQQSVTFWSYFTGKHGSNWNIIIDDASHRNDHIIVMFEQMFKHVKPGGLYIVEDVFAGFVPQFMSNERPHLDEWVKGLFCELNHYGKDFHGHPNQAKEIKLGYLEQHIDFVHLYKGLVIIGKK